ncbi:MAG: site-2 protease family protein [Sphaerochaetaceae bacterium]|nr:site-2 protease family protein [Sphaerochaetaceae bacterium]
MNAVLWSRLLSFLIGIVGINLMILIHETGHLLAAKACGIRVTVIQLGFGPSVFSHKRKDTEYRFCAIPFGGFCKMDTEPHTKQPVNFKNQMKRIISYTAGPFANIIFAIFCLSAYLSMPQVSDVLLPEISLVSPSCAAAKAGLKDGDFILSGNGESFEDYVSLRTWLSDNTDGRTVTVETQRGQFRISAENGMFGILPSGKTTTRKIQGQTFFTSVVNSVKHCFSETGQFLKSLVLMFRGKQKISETLTGIVTTSESLGSFAKKSFSSSFNRGIRTVLYLLGSISVSLAVANLLPFPALDGGYNVIAFTELITGKTLPQKAYLTIQITGLVVLLAIVPILRFFF